MLVENKEKGFTLIELLIVIGIVIILASIVVFAVNPALQFAIARDATRASHLDSLYKNIVSYQTAHGGGFGEISIPEDDLVEICDTNKVARHECGDLIDLSPLVPEYIFSIPVDPRGGIHEKGTGYLAGFMGKRIALAAPNAETRMVVLGIEELPGPPFLCEGSVTFTYQGADFTFNMVESDTGRCWMDRNLGAKRVAVSSNDEDGYGDYFQWGREDDGHQLKESTTSSTQSPVIKPGHPYFIIGYDDWLQSPDSNLWRTPDLRNNPCPEGWRVPTEEEWRAEITALNITNISSAFNSALKLPAAGYRGRITGNFSNVGLGGFYWTTTVEGGRTKTVIFDSSVHYFLDRRAEGASVRCIKD